jgi:hypothetical protein
MQKGARLDQPRGRVVVQAPIWERRSTQALRVEQARGRWSSPRTERQAVLVETDGPMLRHGIQALHMRKLRRLPMGEAIAPRRGRAHRQ